MTSSSVVRIVGEFMWCEDRDYPLAGGCFRNGGCACEYVTLYARPKPEPPCECPSCEFERELEGGP